MRNLHPGANLHPGCKFAPGVYFWPCERYFKNLHPGANLLLPSNAMHERKLYIFILIGDFDKWQAFSNYDVV